MLLWWVTAKSSSCHRQGLYSHAKQGTRVAQRLGIQAQNLIHPAALNRSGIFSIPCFLVFHLQFRFGPWADFRRSFFLAGWVLGRTSALSVCRLKGWEGKDCCCGTQRGRWTLLPWLCLLICVAKKSQ